MRGLTVWVMAAGMAVLAAGSAAWGQVTAGPGHRAQLYFANPAAGQAMVSFDWDSEGALYVSSAATNWAPGMTLWHHDDGGTSQVWSDASVFAGSWVASAGQQVYFNEDSNYRVYAVDSASGAARQVLEHTNLWGMFPRGQHMFISGADATWTAALYVSDIAADGGLSGPVQIGQVGGNSGPLAWDAQGNLFVAEGYNGGGEPGIYRFTSLEVAAALVDPAGSALSGAGRLWTTLEGYSGGGATGMTFDDAGNLLLTATIFGGPSQLRRYPVDPMGEAGEFDLLASSAARLATVRVMDGLTYVSSPAGIYTVSVPEPASLCALAVGAMLLRRRGGRVRA